MKLANKAMARKGEANRSRGWVLDAKGATRPPQEFHDFVSNDFVMAFGRVLSQALSRPQTLNSLLKYGTANKRESARPPENWLPVWPVREIRVYWRAFAVVSKGISTGL